MKTRKILFIIIGVAAIIAGLVCFVLDTGSYERNVTYGGDAYTGIQNASAQAANNIQLLSVIVKTGFGISFIIIGLILIVIGATISNPINNNFTNNPTPIANLPEDKISREISKYNELLKMGVITENEFEEAKKKLLNL